MSGDDAPLVTDSIPFEKTGIRRQFARQFSPGGNAMVTDGGLPPFSAERHQRKQTARQTCGGSNFACKVVAARQACQFVVAGFFAAQRQAAMNAQPRLLLWRDDRHRRDSSKSPHRAQSVPPGKRRDLKLSEKLRGSEAALRPPDFVDNVSVANECAYELISVVCCNDLRTLASRMPTMLRLFQM